MNLYIDTHLNDIIILLEKDGKIIKEKKIIGEKQNSKKLMPSIVEVLDKTKINSIIVCNGPGSFTGVRLGVTVAKTLAFTLNVPIRTITSLEKMAISLDNDEKIVAFNDKNGYYIAIFDNEINLIGNYEYLSNKEFDEYSKKCIVHTDVDIDYKKVVEYALKKDEVNAHMVNPLYIKKIDVEKWLELLKKKT